MSDTSQTNEAFDFSKDYLYFIKDTIFEYSKYIKQYKLINISISKKLSQFQEKYGQNLLDVEKIKNKYKNIIDINSFCEITTIIPKIIQQLIENFNYISDKIDPIIKSVDNIFNEKINMEEKSEFESIGNNLSKAYKIIEKNKNVFLNKMSNIEDVIYKYYCNKNKLYRTNSIEKNNNKNIPNKDKDDIIITKQQKDMALNDGKKMESQCLSCFDSLKNLENSFDNVSKQLKTKYSTYCLNLTKQLKDKIADLALMLKSSFSQPLNKTAAMFEKLNEFNKKENLEKIIYDSFKINKTIMKQKPKYYKMNIFSDSIKINGNKNPKSHINFLEDGLEEMPYFDDYPALNTVKMFYDSFNLVDKEYKLDFLVENEKIQTKKLSQKLLSYYNKGKNEYNETGNILLSKDDIVKLKELLNRHYNRVIFLQDLNTFRAKGAYGIPKDIFDFWNELFDLMTKTVIKEKDYHTAKNLIILSQTYYHVEKENNKNYMFEILKKNDIFRNFKFWEGYIYFSIEKEIIKNIKNAQKNGTLFNKNQKESDDLYGRIVFAQLVSISDNMINFDCDMKKLKELIKPIIKHYNLNEESITIIDDVIHKNDLRKSILLSDEIKQLDMNDLYKNFNAFASITFSNIGESHKKETYEDIYNTPKNEEKKE